MERVALRSYRDAMADVGRRTDRQQLAFQIVAVILTGAAFAGLWAADLLGSVPLWALLLLLAGASVISQVASARWGGDCTRRQLHQRIAVHMTMTTVIIYAIGWGPTLAVGYLVPVTGDLETSGSSAWRPSLLWGIAAIAAGQVAIATGVVSSQVDEPLVHGVGALAALGLAFVVYLLGTKTMAVEQAEAGLQATAADLAAANAAMRDFVAIASHELRTPTTVVKGFASTMQARWDDIAEHDRREYLAAILRSADQLALLIDDLLTVSRIDAGVIEAHPERVVVVREVCRTLDDLGREGDWQIHIPPDLAVLADPEHVRRILRNYLDNASSHGAPPFRVEATSTGDRVEVRVRDDGDGLPEEFLGKAFEKFAQAHSPMGNDRKGTGLGLSIVRGLARAGGGDAWYEPNRPKGSCFAVSFPAA
jgi:signal transduction histidine kinase